MSESTSVLQQNEAAVEGGAQYPLSRRSFFKLAGYSAAGLAFYSGEIARHDVQVVRRTISLPNLPDAFAGFKIVQISDIHFEEYTEAAFLKAVVRRVNTLDPDLVLLTGDFVSDGPLPAHLGIKMGYRCAGILNGLTCPLRYAVLGNHDTIVGAGAITDALVEHQMPVLNNRSTPIERGRDRIWLAGVEDVLEGHPDLSRALPKGRRPDSEPLMLLSHEPDFADYALHRGISLILSGHTHGGQIRVPFLDPLFLPALGRKYVEGHFLLSGAMQLYVNRGIGTVGIPFRFRCPPEITLITLAPGPPQQA